MLPEASTPMMPALAEDSTASMKRRRLSIRSLALTSSSRWVRSSCVILLKVSPSCARSPSDLWTGTWTCRSPVETILAALIRRRIGATSQLAKFSPISTDAIRMVSAITANISANATWMPSRRDSIWAYSATLAWVCLQLRRPRADRAGARRRGRCR